MIASRIQPYALAILLLASSTATASERKFGQTPQAGVEATITVGSQLLERHNMVAVPQPQLRDDLEVSLGIQGKIVIPRGAELQVVRPNPLKACTTAQNTYIDLFVGPRDAACLYDDDMDGTFDQASAAKIMLTKRKIKTPAPYTVIDVPASAGSDFFKIVLTYLGSAGGVLRLSYREFSHDMARPAFTEELSFPIGDTFPQTIAWRDTKITLLGLDNNGLQYRVEGGQ